MNTTYTIYPVQDIHPLRLYLTVAPHAYDTLKGHVSQHSWEAARWLDACQAMADFRLDAITGMLRKGCLTFNNQPETRFYMVFGPTLTDTEPEAVMENITLLRDSEAKLAKIANIALEISDPESRGIAAYIASSAGVAARLLKKIEAALTGMQILPLTCTNCLHVISDLDEISEGCPICGAPVGAFAPWGDYGA